VKLGALQDTTGATSDVGKDEAMGVREAVQYYNDSGGINGKKIRMFQYDYGYRVPEAVTTYKRFRDYDKVVMVLGWGPAIRRPSLLRSITIRCLISPALLRTPLRPQEDALQLRLWNRLFHQRPRSDHVLVEEVWKKDAKWKELREKGPNRSLPVSSTLPLLMRRPR